MSMYEMFKAMKRFQNEKDKQIKQLEAENERIAKRLVDDIVSKLSGDELDRYLLKSTSMINELTQKIKQLEFALKCEGDNEAKFQQRIKQLENAISDVLINFRISSSLADNVNNLTLMQSKLKKALKE